jgi:integrase
LIATATGTSRNGRITFNELVDMHWMPTLGRISPNTRKNHASHLGVPPGVEKPRRKGAKAERAAQFQLRAVVGETRIMDIQPQDVRLWQARMLAAGYEHSTILAKRSLLRGILNLAVLNGWIDGPNLVDAVEEPPKIQTEDEDRYITPDEWPLIRAGLSGEGTLLLVDTKLDTKLDTGLRFGEITALRPCDVLDPTERDEAALWVRRAVIWPGKKWTEAGEAAWQINEYPKGRRWRKTSVSPHVFDAIRAYVDRNGIAEDALIFDFGRLRAEHAAARQERAPREGLPSTPATGRYVNPTTKRSGAHGRYTTYNLGCRCIPCRNDYTEYRFWWARARGRRSVAPWTEPGFLESRSHAVDPVWPQWFRSAVWVPAVKGARLGWMPTLHQLRHAMVTWSLDGGANPRVVQKDAGHSSLQTTMTYAHRSERVTGERVAAMAATYAQMPNGPVPPSPVTAAVSAMPLDPADVRAWLETQDPAVVAAVLADVLRRESPPPLRAVDGASPGGNSG